MTLNAFLEAPEGPPGPDEAALGGDVVAVTARADADTLLPAARRRAVGVHAQLVASVLVGSAAAALVGAGLVVAVGVLTSWVFVHLRPGGARLQREVPDLATLTRHVSVPFTLIALAVALGGVKEAALAQALVISTASTAGLFATALVLRRWAPPTRLLVVGDRVGVGQIATGWAQRTDVTLVGAALLEKNADGTQPDLDLETFGLPTVQGVDDVAARVDRLRADAVVVLPSPGLTSADIRRLGWALEDTRATLAVHTGLEGVAPHRLAVSTLAGAALTEVGSSRPTPLVRGAKALMDRVGGTLLPVLLAPVVAGLAMLVRLDSCGPGLFSQTRIGRNGKPFKVYKLRTMCTEAEVLKHRLVGVNDGNAVLFKVREDPRVTRLGRLLRKTSLDELPQLINVVKGDMSLVGPRPALPQEVAGYDETARRRLAVRPGITGLWQVSGRSDLDWDETVALDVRYTDNITLGDDLRICLRTVKAVTSGKGAY